MRSFVHLVKLWKMYWQEWSEKPKSSYSPQTDISGLSWATFTKHNFVQNSIGLRYLKLFEDEIKHGENCVLSTSLAVIDKLQQVEKKMFSAFFERAWSALVMLLFVIGVRLFGNYVIVQKWYETLMIFCVGLYSWF